MEKNIEVKRDFFNSDAVMEMFKFDEETKAIAQRIEQNTAYGKLSLYDFELLIKHKVMHYIKTGLAKTVENKLKTQLGTNVPPETVLRALIDFARYEVLYGLQPLIHTDWIRETIYVKAEGYLYYARDKLKTLKWDIEQKNDVTIVKCTASDGVMEVVGEEYIPSQKIDSNLLEKARTKSMRRALRRLFPIGSDELFDEVTGQYFGINQTVSNNIDEIF